MYVILVSTFV